VKNVAYKNNIMAKPYQIPDEYQIVVSEPNGWIAYLTKHSKNTNTREINQLVINFARKGVPFSHAKMVYESLGMPQKKLCDMIGITDRTFQRNIKENKMLNIIQSEKVLEAGILFHKGLSIFGSREKFIKWLNTPSPVLSTDPISYIDTNVGIQLVISELNRIEHGIY
jgi:putative toxin-antitoxin system antitoxin component (TIGR02293 family)